VDPIRRIEAIRCSLDPGEEGAAEIRAAAWALEAVTDAGAVLAAVADPGFPRALIAAAEGCAELEQRAWFTLAAAGARRTRQVLAWRASQLVDPEQLAVLATKRRRPRERGFQFLVANAGDPAVAAWALLAHLEGGELRAMVRAQPALAAAHRRARGVRRFAPALRPALG
jgi:hypothetical protein